MPKPKPLDITCEHRDAHPDDPECPDCGIRMFVAPLMLSELEMRALVRQLHRQYIPTEGTSGPTVHALLERIRKHVGPKRHAQYVAEPSKPL